MTTLTTRPIPLLPLVLPIPMYCNDRPSSTGSGSPPSSLGVGLGQSDSLLLERHHEVTSPRISSAGSSYSRNCGNSPIRMDSSVLIDQESRRTRSFSHMEHDHNRDNCDKINDRMSCCSDDSELSVGQEECCDNGSAATGSVSKRSRFSGTGNDHDQGIDECESGDNLSSLSEDNRVRGGSEPLCNDDASSDSNSIRESGDPGLLSSPSSLGVQAGSIIRPSPTRLQEEFLRKSHLYAEQLMKQQMQFMAVARASAFQLHHGALSPDMCKVGFRPPENANTFSSFGGIQSHLNAISKISSQLTCEESALSRLTAFGLSSSRELSQSPPSSLNQFHQHHNHPLLPHQLLNNNLNERNLKFSIDNILKADFGRRITDPILKRAAGQSAGGGKSSHNGRRTSNRTNSEKHGAPIDLTSSLLAGSSVNSNSAISTPSVNLRTSIDPIPTATSPSSASSSPNFNVATGVSSSQSSSTCTATSPSSSSTPAAASNSGGSTTENGSSSGGSVNNGSGGPVVWPAWVYCTRYSDRPSSGE